MGNEQSSPLQQAAAHDDIDKVHALMAQNKIELNGTDKVSVSHLVTTDPFTALTHLTSLCRMGGPLYILHHTGAVIG